MTKIQEAQHSIAENEKLILDLELHIAKLEEEGVPTAR
jgi:hypothetical protein